MVGVLSAYYLLGGSSIPPMYWHDAYLILTILLGVFGFCFLAAGFLSLNTVVGERSRKDGCMLMEKQMSGLARDKWEAKREMGELLPVAWAKQRVTRWLIYFGVGFCVAARILSEWATPLQSLRAPPPPNHALQRMALASLSLAASGDYVSLS